jgi:hypothetical protein
MGEKSKSYVLYRGKDLRVMSILHIVGNGSGDDIHTCPITSSLLLCIKWG